MFKQQRATVQQRAEWLFRHYDMLLPDSFKQWSNGEWYRSTLTEANDQAWKRIVREMKIDGLIAPTTYYRDVNLTREYRMCLQWKANGTGP